jgi:hypothetical protein
VSSCANAGMVIKPMAATADIKILRRIGLTSADERIGLTVPGVQEW